MFRERGNRCENSCENLLRGVGLKCLELRNEGFKMGEEFLEENRKNDSSCLEDEDRLIEVFAEFYVVGFIGNVSCLLGYVKIIFEDKVVESINVLNI